MKERISDILTVEKIITKRQRCSLSVMGAQNRVSDVTTAVSYSMNDLQMLWVGG